MLTLFSTAKPFRGHSGIIQQNALRSWKLLHHDVEVILFGDDEGAAEAALRLGLRHEPHVERNELGTKRLDYIFDRAQSLARHPILCYVNCDIILLRDFVGAIRRLQSLEPKFLMVGRRWDTDVTEPIDFSAADWEERLESRALAANDQKPEYYIDYFAFSSGLYQDHIAPLVIGRVYWDNWLLWRARDRGAAVVDASHVVRAVHQNHDYGYHPKGKEGVWTDEQSRRNFQLAGGYSHLRYITDADKILTPQELKDNPKRLWVGLKRRSIQTKDLLVSSLWHPIWFRVLGITRPLRQALGLRSKAVHPRQKV
jgi:hypothetical protein